MPEQKKTLPELLILGAGGYGQALAEVAQLLNQWSNIYFVDDQWPNKNVINGIKVVSNIVGLKEWIENKYVEGIAAVGNNQIRRKWHEILMACDIPLATIIHPSAIISPSVKIGKGVSIMAGCILSSNVIIKNGVLLNLGVLLDHDVMVSEYAHLSVGVKCAGGELIEENAILK